MSRTRGGRKRSRAAEQRARPAPRALSSSGGQAHLVARQPHPGAVERDLAWRAPGPAAAATKAGAGSRGSSCSAQPLQADAGQVGVLGVEGGERRRAAPRFRRIQPAARERRERAPRPRCGPADSAAAIAIGRLGGRARGRGRRRRGRHGRAARPSSAASARLGIGDARARRAGPGARACGACARARAGRGSGRRRWCAARTVSRRTKRSPAAAAIGRSSTSCT